jgi:hypothetical protein
MKYVKLYLQAPHRSPSALIARTASSISFISVSSSHGFTSRIMLDLAIRAGSEMKIFKYTSEVHLSNFFLSPQVILSAIYKYDFHGTALLE